MIFRTEAGRRAVLQRYQEMLSRWPVPAECLRVCTRQGETFVLGSGPRDAPPLTLLHGSGSNTAMWMGDVTLWAEHFRVYAVDIIGEPGFSAPTRPPLESDAYALWLDDVLRELGVQRTPVVGASLGGWMALDYAIRRTERVERLVLLCPGGIGRQKVGFLLKVLLYRPFGEWGLRRSIEAVAGVDAQQTPEIAEYIALNFKHFLPRRDRLPVFPDAALRRLRMPTLAIVGGRDAMFDSADTCERLKRNAPQANVILLPDVAHSITGQAEPILHFLQC